MINLIFLAKIAKRISLPGFSKTAETVARRSGKSKIAVMADMLFCGLRYGCGLSDYRLYHFDTLTGAQRKTYMTRGYNNRVVKLVNDPENHVLFDNKVRFLKKFGEYAGRDWLDLQTAGPADFIKFLDGKDEIIVKPLSGSCGKGIEKLKKADFESPEKMFETIRDSGFGLAEECLVQHPDISAIYPLSVNTLRIVTIYTDSKVHVLYAFIRIGNHGAVVDNLNSGGMCAPIDVETGVISHPGYDRDETVYEKHPYTGTEIVGRQIPHVGQGRCGLCRCGRFSPQHEVHRLGRLHDGKRAGICGGQLLSRTRHHSAAAPYRTRRRPAPPVPQVCTAALTQLI